MGTFSKVCELMPRLCVSLCPAIEQPGPAYAKPLRNHRTSSLPPLGHFVAPVFDNRRPVRGGQSNKTLHHKEAPHFSLVCATILESAIRESNHGAASTESRKDTPSDPATRSVEVSRAAAPVFASCITPRLKLNAWQSPLALLVALAD